MNRKELVAKLEHMFWNYDLTSDEMLALLTAVQVVKDANYVTLDTAFAIAKKQAVGA